jgi:protease II
MGSRTIHGITWHDDLAWMESMKGKPWTSHIQKEQKRWDDVTKPLEDSIQILSGELDSFGKTLHTMLFRTGNSNIEIGMESGVSISWKWKNETETRRASILDANPSGSRVWTIEEIGEGAELYAVRMYDRESPDSYKWQHSGIGPFVGILGGRCYCIEAKKSLVYWRVVSWDAETGKDRKVLYEEKDYRYNLSLQGMPGCVYIIRQAGTKEDAFMINKAGLMTVLEGVSLEPRRFIFCKCGGGYLVWASEEGWVARQGATKFILPKLNSEQPEYINLERGFLITKWNGLRTLYRIGSGVGPRVIWKRFGGILIDPWDSPWVRFVCPGEEAYWWNSKTTLPPPSCGKRRKTTLHLAQSVDGTRVPFLLVCDVKNKKSAGLLVSGYGAYGLSTPLMTHRWEPLIQRGWTVAIGMWRGGGDRDPEWEDAGRCAGRARSLEDAEAIVREAQKISGVSANRTVLYGRSAGGLWVGGLTAKYPNGEVSGGVYMEVPYLDVLRTTTNRALPLTEIETDEFGLPEQRISDFVSILEWSPMELMPSGGIPGVWQIVRTGVNDSEVLAYESVKWITRSKNKMAYLAIEHGQGHFVVGEKGMNQQAEDLAMILKLVQ